MLTWVSVVACTAPTVWAAPALAQTIDYAAAGASATSEEAAAAAYRAAFSLYESGDLRGALLKMKEAHRLSQRAELLYNIARLEKELGDCAAALGDYQRYLELVPQGTYRAEAEGASAQLRAQCGVAPAAAPVIASTPAAVGTEQIAAEESRPASSSTEEPPPAYWTTPRIIGWSAIAAGTLAGAGAVFFTLSAHDTHEEIQTSRDNGEYADYDSLQAEQRRDQRWAWGLGITGGLLAAGGVLMLALAPSSQSGNGAVARFQVQPGLLAATYAQRF